MKKILTLLLIFSFCLIFTSCDIKIISDSPVVNDEKEDETKESTDVTNNITNEITNHITTDTSEIDIVGDISDLEDAVTTCIQKVEQSVIGIAFKVETEGSLSDGTTFKHEDRESVGSGVIYKREEIYNNDHTLKTYKYYVITNCHVVSCDTSTHKTLEHNAYAYIESLNTEYPLTILGKDDKVDLACVTFESGVYFPVIEFGDSDELVKGQFCVVIGNPDGFEYYGSATFGVISNLNRYLGFDTDSDNIKDYNGCFIQVDAAINPGNSGGGLFTLDGKLIGINSVKLTSVKIDNMAFSIPSNIVKTVICDYLEKGVEIVRPRLGVTTVPCNTITTAVLAKYDLSSLPDIYNGESPYGVFITDVSEQGTLVDIIKVGDILLQIDDDRIYSNTDITVHLNSFDSYNVGDVVKFTYYSQEEGKVVTIEAVLKTSDK